MNQGSNWLMTGEIPQRQGSLHPNIAPYGETFLTKDHKYILLAAGSDVQFSQLCKITGNDHLMNDERFLSNQLRVKNRKEMFLFFADKMKTDSAENWNKKFNEAKIPNGIIKNLKEVFEDKQAVSLIKTEIINGVETKRIQNSIFKIITE
jgi:crotonobetainyl-CoA:carnitine CoA-transferase CaiB-like acyl-CoA transferase